YAVRIHIQRHEGTDKKVDPPSHRQKDVSAQHLSRHGRIGIRRVYATDSWMAGLRASEFALTSRDEEEDKRAKLHSHTALLVKDSPEEGPRVVARSDEEFSVS